MPAAAYIVLADQRWIHRFWGFATLLPFVTSAPICGQHAERSDLSLTWETSSAVAHTLFF
jgi:hypothetical protein